MKEFQLKFITDKYVIRTLKILAALQDGEVIPLKELADIVKASDRTLLSDFHKLKNYFSHSINLTSTHTGYSLKIICKKDFVEKKRTLLAYEPLFKILESIFYNELHSITTWGDRLHTTVSTLTKQIARVQPILDDYNLKIEKNPVNFKGNEINIRQFFHDFYYESDITPHTVFPSVAAQEIALNIKREHFFDTYTYISFTEFSYIIFIALQRFSSGKTVQNTNPELLFLEDYVTDHLAKGDFKKIRTLIYNTFNIELTLKESTYLYIQLITRRSTTSRDAEIIFITRFNKWSGTHVLTSEFLSMLNISENTKKYSRVFFESFFTNIQLKHLYAPILNQNLSDVTNFVIDKYSEYFNLSRKFLKKNFEKQLSLSKKQVDDISADLALYTSTLKSTYWGKKTNIAFLFEGNRFISEQIRANTGKYLGSFHNVFFPDVTELSDLYFYHNNINLVVTNYSEYITELDVDTEIILFESIPTSNDWTRLLKKLSPSEEIEFKIF